VPISLDYYLFTEDPYVAFGKRYNLPRKFWVEIFHNRYMWRGYSMGELKEIIHILSKKHNEIDISEKTIRRWIYITEIYNHAQKIIDKGVKITDTEYFDKHEDYLTNNYKLNVSR
jgi:hypothetical protein